MEMLEKTLTRLTGLIALSLVGLTPGHANEPLPSSSVMKQEVMINPSDLLNNIRKQILIGDAEDAFELLQRAEKANLSDRQKPMIHNGYCVTYQMLKQLDKALQHCNRAIELRPNAWRYLNNRGNVFLKMGAPGLALREYQRALKLVPWSDVVQHNISLAEKQTDEDALI